MINDGLRAEQKLKQYFKNEVKRVANIFTRVGEGFINDARMDGNYKDRTGNLRSSAGYAIGLSGDYPSANFTGPQVKEGLKGQKQALEYGEQLIKNEPGDAIVLTGFAGMEYAIDVEARGKDVITSATKSAMRKLRWIIIKK